MAASNYYRLYQGIGYLCSLYVGMIQTPHNIDQLKILVPLLGLNKATVNDYPAYHFSKQISHSSSSLLYLILQTTQAIQVFLDNPLQFYQVQSH